MIKEGILNLNKPSGITSNDCVYRLRKVSGLRKIGHTGTLDPLASGVLPLCIGGSARVTEYLDGDLKKYECIMQLGVETETYDADGAIITDVRDRFGSEIVIRRADLERVFAAQLGNITQLPPV